MRKAKLILAFLFTLVVPLSTYAAPQEFEIDKTHSSIMFSVSHFGFSKVIGRFNDFSGNYTFDDANMLSGKVDLTINTTSIDTGMDKRDEHLRSPDFFDVEKFPTMTFTSTKVKKIGKNSAKVTGDLTLLGVTKPVTLDVKFNKLGEYPMPQYKGIPVAGFSVHGKIKRSDFGMKTFLGPIGDEIELMIETEGHGKK